jgi:putative SOS response-associated peptidase YedK
MPAILAPDESVKWLDVNTPRKEAHALLKPYPAELLAVSEANARVNSPKDGLVVIFDRLVVLRPE